MTTRFTPTGRSTAALGKAENSPDRRNVTLKSSLGRSIRCIQNGKTGKICVAPGAGNGAIPQLSYRNGRTMNNTG